MVRYINLNIVSIDGSTIYRNAISKSHPSAKDYKGSQSNLRYYCSKLKKKSELISFKILPQTIKRNILLKLLYTPSNNIKELSDGLLDKIYTVYLFFKSTIIYEYNNGLAEGSVNKLKVIKRIMYCRNKFKLLRNKITYLENSKKIN